MIDDTDNLPRVMVLGSQPPATGYASAPGRFTCYPALWTDGHPRGLDQDDPLADLAVSAYAEKRDVAPNVWGWRTEYRSPYSVDLRRAEAMARTLRNLRAALERHAARYGYPQTFPAYLAAVAVALRLDGFAYAPDENARRSTYADNEWRRTDAAGMTDWTARTLRALVPDPRTED